MTMPGKTDNVPEMDKQLYLARCENKYMFSMRILIGLELLCTDS